MLTCLFSQHFDSEIAIINGGILADSLLLKWFFPSGGRHAHAAVSGAVHASREDFVLEAAGVVGVEVGESSDNIFALLLRKLNPPKYLNQLIMRIDHLSRIIRNLSHKCRTFWLINRLSRLLCQPWVRKQVTGIWSGSHVLGETLVDKILSMFAVWEELVLREIWRIMQNCHVNLFVGGSHERSHLIEQFVGYASQRPNINTSVIS